MRINFLLTCARCGEPLEYNPHQKHCAACKKEAAALSMFIKMRKASKKGIGPRLHGRALQDACIAALAHWGIQWNVNLQPKGKQ